MAHCRYNNILRTFCAWLRCECIVHKIDSKYVSARYIYYRTGPDQSIVYLTVLTVPIRYEGQTHSRHGYYVLVVAAFLSIMDLIALIGRLVQYVKSSDHEKVFSLHFWRTVILGREDIKSGSGPEYTNLVAEEPEDFEEAQLKATADHAVPLHVRRNQSIAALQTEHFNEDRTANWTNDVGDRHHQRSRSSMSERTLFGVFSPTKQSSNDTLHDMDDPIMHKVRKLPFIHQSLRVVFGTLERGLVFAGYGQLLTGIVIYTGGCRGNYINGCLAHLISA